jgi:heme-degrading monooxygenase HmoA
VSSADFPSGEPEAYAAADRLGDRRSVMFARVSTISGSPEGIPNLETQLRENFIPAARQLPGFNGVLALADRSSGKTLTVTLWESEQAMKGSEDTANKIRQDAASAMGDEIVSVERFEVVLDER